MAEHGAHQSGWMRWITTTDHREIGLMYLWTAFAFFLIGGVAALLFRAELFLPGDTISWIDGRLFGELVTLHGTVMVFLWLMPAFAGFGNYLVPIMVKAPDMAFPRMNALSFWLIPPGGLLLILGPITRFLSPLLGGGYIPSPDTGWTLYPPLSTLDPSIGVDMWIAGLALLGVGSTVGSINFIITIAKMRGEGVTMHNMSLFAWSWLATALLLLFSLPVVTVAFVMILLDRNFGTSFFMGAGSDPILYQHLFWFFGHPEVYVVVLPAFGILNEVIPKFSARPVFGYKSMAYAMLAIGIVGFAVWAHHMFTTGIDPRVRAIFMFNTMLVGVPTGIKVFNWLATMWGGILDFKVPMMHALGFIWLFVIGGITGVMLGSIPVDYHLHDSYFVVAHFHYTMVGGAVFGIFCGLYYWWPRFFGRMYNRALAGIHFWLMFIGFNLTFFPQFMLGLSGMIRRAYDYPVDLNGVALTGYNQASTIGAFLIATSILVFMINAAWSFKNGQLVGEDPWGGAKRTEWELWAPENRGTDVPSQAESTEEVA